MRLRKSLTAKSPHGEILLVHNFATRLQAHMSERAEVDDMLPDFGKALAESVYGTRGRMTLREAARQTGLSPTYLSHVRSGRVTVSPGAYLKLSKV
jgi:transcriptional regulator with XRE-family HTH domain